MKKYLIILVMMLVFAGSLHAAIGWSGGIWPNSSTDQTNGFDITVYYQIWKDGVTSLPGRGDSLSATIFYKTQSQPSFSSEAMTFNVDVGNNDEYFGIIPNAIFSAGDTVFFYCEGYDSTDATYSYGNDQNGVGPFTDTTPGSYNIVAGLNQDVTVTFQVDMTIVDPVYTVSVAGSFNGWTAGVDTLNDVGNNIYSGDVLFTAGTNPYQEYKFVNGSIWEDYISNRILNIDDSSPTMILPPVYFNDIPPDEIFVTFQVDMTLQIWNDWFVPGVDTAAVSGSMNGWNKWELTDIDGDDIYTGEYSFYGCVSDVIEYKFRINDNFELFDLPNRSFTIDDTVTTIPVVFYDDFNPNTPTNLTAVVDEWDVDLAWDAPATRDVDYYNLYRDDSVIALVYHPTTIFTDTSVPFGNHVYYVTAVYPEGQSLPSNTQTVFVGTNTPPVAVAGDDKTVIEDHAVYLDGSGSYDPDGLPITYHWSAPADIVLSDSTAVDPSFVAPMVDEDTIFTLSLIVFDGELYSDPDYVDITVLNSVPPTADFSAFPLTGSIPLEVTFTDESYSNITDWNWNFGDGETSEEQNPVHTYTSAGTFSVILTVTNFFGSDTITKWNYIHVTSVPLDPPTNLTYTVNVDDVTLDWDAPTSDERDLTFYKLYRDDVVIVVIYPPTTMYTDTNLPLGEYAYFVTAMYPEGESAPTNPVTVSIINNPPVANAGPDQTVDEGDFVQLDGSGSYDPEGLTLTYSWTAPAQITLDDPAIVDPSFTAPLVTQDEVFPIELLVFDGNSWSEPDTVFITVRELMDAGDQPQNFETALHANHPNPFTTSTLISFSLKENAHVEIEIYNIKGAHVASLIRETLETGNYEIEWDGTDQFGHNVSPGIYFCRISAGQYVSTNKMILMK